MDQYKFHGHGFSTRVTDHKDSVAAKKYFKQFHAWVPLSNGNVNKLRNRLYIYALKVLVWRSNIRNIPKKSTWFLLLQQYVIYIMQFCVNLHAISSRTKLFCRILWTIWYDNLLIWTFFWQNWGFQTGNGCLRCSIKYSFSFSHIVGVWLQISKKSQYEKKLFVLQFLDTKYAEII